MAQKENAIDFKKGAPGFEPGTSRSAVECSTTELYPHTINHARLVTTI